MAKYVKRPIPITAIQWTGENAKELAEFTNGRCQFRVGRPSIKIPTLEGDMGANIGDYIVRGVEGEFTLAVKTFLRKLMKKSVNKRMLFVLFGFFNLYLG